LAVGRKLIADRYFSGDTTINDPTLHIHHRRLPLNGAFKGRGRNYLSLLACPVDRSGLRLAGDSVRCTADPAHTFSFLDGILQLVPAEQRDLFNNISADHDAQCAAEGLHSPAEDEFKALPRGGLAGYPDDYWPQQAAATALLWRFLEAIRLANGGLPIGPMGEAAVTGAGLGWLAYALDVAGYTTLAIDARAGPRHGLGVYPIARYLRVQADMVMLPLARAAFDWVIFQEGLGGGDEQTNAAALDRALESLRPGGWLAVIDAWAPSPDEAATVHTLFEDAGLELVTPPRRQGWRGRLLELRDRLTGREAGVPPVMVARSPR
jgi:hypothetical protein